MYPQNQLWSKTWTCKKREKKIPKLWRLRNWIYLRTELFKDLKSALSTLSLEPGLVWITSRGPFQARLFSSSLSLSVLFNSRHREVHVTLGLCQMNSQGLQLPVPRAVVQLGTQKCPFWGCADWQGWVRIWILTLPQVLCKWTAEFKLRRSLECDLIFLALGIQYDELCFSCCWVHLPGYCFCFWRGGKGEIIFFFQSSGQNYLNQTLIFNDTLFSLEQYLNLLEAWPVLVLPALLGA